MVKHFKQIICLLCIVALCVAPIDGTYAKYTASNSGKDEARVAAWVVKVDGSTDEIKQYEQSGSYATNDTIKYEFKVSNCSGNTKCEVDAEYYIEVSVDDEESFNQIITMGIYETGNGTGTATTGTGTSSYVDGVKDITNKQYVFKNAGIYEFKAGEEKTRSYNLFLTVKKNAKFNSKVNVKVVATQKD